MSEAGSENLYFAGPGCGGVPVCPTDWFNPDKTGQNLQTSGLGSIPQWSFGIEDIIKEGVMPAKEIAKDDNSVYTIDCLRSQTDFVINRHLDFTYCRPGGFNLDKGHKNQISLYKWMCRAFNELVNGYCLWMSFIPMKLFVDRVFWCVTKPVDGLEFSIVEKYTGKVICAGIDGSVHSTGTKALPPSCQFKDDCNQVYGIRIDTMPLANEDPCKKGKGKLDGFAVQMSVHGICPFAMH